MDRDKLLALIKAKREELDGHVKIIGELNAKSLDSDQDDLTDDETKTWTEAIATSEGLKSEIENAEKSLGLHAFMSENAPEFKGMVYGNQVGTDVVYAQQNGLDPVFMKELGHDLGIETCRLMMEDDYDRAFEGHMRGRLDNHDRGVLQAVLGRFDVQKTMREGIDDDGGYLAPPTYVAMIISPDAAPTALFDLVNHIPSGSDTLKIPKLDFVDTDDIFSNPMRFVYDGEEDPPTEGTTPKWGVHEIPVYGGKIEFPVTRDLLEDAVVPLETIIASEFRDSFRLTMEQLITTNPGVKGPRGMLDQSGTAGFIPEVNIGDPADADGLIDVTGDLPAQYRDGAMTVMQLEDTYTTYQKLQSTAGNFVFGNLGSHDQGLAGATQEKLLGRPIKFNPFMPTPATAAKTIITGNFKKTYVFTQRKALLIERQKLPRDAFVFFVMRARNGGKVVQARASRIGVQS